MSDAVPPEHAVRAASLTLIEAAEALLDDAECTCGPVSYYSSWTCDKKCPSRVARENLRAVIERERPRC